MSSSRVERKMPRDGTAQPEGLIEFVPYLQAGFCSTPPGQAFHLMARATREGGAVCSFGLTQLSGHAVACARIVACLTVRLSEVPKSLLPALEVEEGLDSIEGCFAQAPDMRGPETIKGVQRYLRQLGPINRLSAHYCRYLSDLLLIWLFQQAPRGSVSVFPEAGKV